MPAAGAHAAPLVEESFNIGTGSGEYTDGASLKNAPTTGAATNSWGAAWTVTGTTESISEAGGLTYSAGSVGTIGGTGGSNGNALGTADTRRAIASDTTLQTANELWMRVLFRPTNDGNFFSFRSDGSGGNGRFTMRWAPGAPPDPRQDILLQDLSGTQTTDGFGSLTLGSTNLFLFKVTADRTGSAAETVQLWVNPTTSDESQLGAATATVSGNILNSTNDQFNQFDFTGGDTNGFGIDEIAIGSTFGDVVLLGEEKRRYGATASRDSLVVELPLPALQEVLASNQPQGVAWRGSIMARLHRLEPQEAETFSWRILEKLSQLTDAA